MNHLLAGIALPFLIACVMYARRGCRASFRFLVLTPVCMVLGATWSVAPDLPRIVGLRGLDRMLASTNPWIDVFFFHYTINCHESSSPWFNVAFVVMVICLFAAAWRELRAMEHG